MSAPFVRLVIGAVALGSCLHGVPASAEEKASGPQAPSARSSETEDKMAPTGKRDLVVPAWVGSGEPTNAQEIPMNDYDYLARWLDTHAKAADDYVIELFARHDVVILGEFHHLREHKGFVIELIPRLYQEACVRVIGWEFSRHSDNSRLEAITTAPEYDREAALQFARDQVAHEWNSKEHWDIIEAVWRLNSTLEPGQEKMRLVGLDMDLDMPRVQISLKTLSQDSPEFKELLSQVLKRDGVMAEQVEKEIIEKNQKGLVFVGRCHDFTHYEFPPEVNLGREIMGRLLYKKHDDRVFQVWLSGEQFLRPIEGVMALRKHKRVGFDLYRSPFANVMTPEHWSDAPGVPLQKVARGYVYLGPRAHLHKNTPINGFVTEEMFMRHKRYYEIDFGRKFQNAEEVDKYLQMHRFPDPQRHKKAK